MNLREKLKTSKGITLIALVITMIILIILSVVAISITFEENGLFETAKLSKEKSKEGEVRDEITVAWAAAGIEGAINNWGTADKALSLQTKLKETDSSATARVNGTNIKVKYRGYQAIINPEAGITSIAKIVTDPNALTVGDAYDDELIKIGDAFTYTGDTQTEWIVFGKDENGDVLLTTATPVTDRQFTAIGDAQHWLSYETDLHAHCSTAIYGDSSKGITARSITLDDINRVTGYTKPTFTPIIIGTGTGEHNCYYPSLDAAGYTTNENADPKVYQYWKKPTSESEKTFTAAEIHSDYYYGYNYNSSDITTSENLKYVLGIAPENPYDPKPGEGLFQYVVASRRIITYSDANSLAYTGASVQRGVVNQNSPIFVRSYNSYTQPNSDTVTKPVRPIVVLPYDIEVEEGLDGVYKLAE